MRFPFVPLTLFAAVCFSLTACGKIPTWGELTGGAAPVQPAPLPTQMPVQVMPATPVVVPAVNPEEVIAKFKSLRPAEVSDMAIMQLTELNEGLEQITEINADGSQVSKDAFNNITKLTNLQQLSLASTRVDNEACQKIAQISSLEILILTDTKVNDVGVAALSDMQNLKHLELIRCSLGRNAFDAIGKLPSLKFIALEQTNMSNDELDLVCNAKTITSLRIGKNVLNDYALLSLKKLSGLEYLELSHTGITGEGLQFATKGGGLKSLISLGLYGCPVNAAGVKAISSFKNMERLNIGEIGLLNDEALHFMISNMKNLKYLNLSKCSTITGQGLIGLKGNKQIEELHIDQCQGVGDGVVQFLSTLKSLRTLTVGASAVTPAGINHLKAALPECKVQ